MREIKFRAWDRKRKEMFQVHEIEYSRIDNSLNNVVGYTDAGGSWWNQHGGGNMMYANEFRYILLQYTGLKDNNGKEIYEGDVLHITCNFEQRKGTEKYAVEYCDGTFHCNEWTLYELVRNYSKGTQDFEVIGNIYENPELLN